MKSREKTVQCVFQLKNQNNRVNENEMVKTNEWNGKHGRKLGAKKHIV